MADDNDAADEPLAREAAAGDRDSFRRLVERHRDSVFRFAFHLLRDAHSADDAAQDVFVKAFRRISSFDHAKGTFSGWLATITRNTCLDAIERRKRDRPPGREESPETPFNDHSVEGREIFTLLDTVLDNLAEPFRSTFILAEIEERPLQEIANMEGVALGTVKSRVSRAREKLQAKLKPLLTEHRNS